MGIPRGMNYVEEIYEEKRESVYHVEMATDSDTEKLVAPRRTHTFLSLVSVPHI